MKNTRTRLVAVDAFFALCGSGRPTVVRKHLAQLLLTLFGVGTG